MTIWRVALRLLVALAAEGVAWSSDHPLPSPQEIGRPLPKHRILKEEVVDIPLKVKVMESVLIKGDVNKEGLLSLLADRYDKTRLRTGFRHHSHPTNIYIYVYAIEPPPTRPHEWVAMLAKSYIDSEPTLTIDDRRLAALKEPSQKRFGLSDQQRRKVYMEQWGAVRRANKEAERKIPHDEAQQFLFARELEKRYTAEVAAKHGLTDIQKTELFLEGEAKGWPRE
jgi:hypothetical protein